MLKETFLILILFALGCVLIAPATAEAPVSDIPTLDDSSTGGSPMNDESEISPSPIYEDWDCETCQATDGYTFCLWKDGYMFDYLCLPNKADKYHVPCGEEDGDTIVDGVKVKCPDMDKICQGIDPEECGPGFECIFEEGLTVGTCTDMYNDEGQPCEYSDDCGTGYECLFQEGELVGTCTAMKDEGEVCGWDATDNYLGGCKTDLSCMWDEGATVGTCISMDYPDCDYYSCNDENYDTCIEEPMCSEINCYSYDQICDGIVDCQESGTDEIGCDLSEGDRMVKMRKPQV